MLVLPRRRARSQFRDVVAQFPDAVRELYVSLIVAIGQLPLKGSTPRHINDRLQVRICSSLGQGDCRFGASPRTHADGIGPAYTHIVRRLASNHRNWHGSVMPRVNRVAHVVARDPNVALRNLPSASSNASAKLQENL